MGIVDKTIKDGIGERGVGDALMPVGHRELSHHHGGTLAISVVNDLEQITCLHRSERIAKPVVRGPVSLHGERNPLPKGVPGHFR